MSLNQHYIWEIQTRDGSLFMQGRDNWRQIDPAAITRVSFVPTKTSLPRHDVVCGPGNRFLRRFAKGFLKQSHGFRLTEYVQCVQTERFRFWVFSNGQATRTAPDYMVRI